MLYLVASSQVFAQLLRRREDKATIEKALEQAGLGELQVEILSPEEAETKLAGLNPASDPGEQSAREAEPEPAAEGDSPLMERLRGVFPPDLIHEHDEEGS